MSNQDNESIFKMKKVNTLSKLLLCITLVSVVCCTMEGRQYSLIVYLIWSYMLALIAAITEQDIK